jgi:3-hydroxybutyryl-CoA dehydrogenase
VEAREVRAVGIVGCGTMGSGIAEVVARAGASALVLETSQELLDAGRARIERSLATAVERGKLEVADRDAALERISGAVDVAAFADVDLVIEAASEDRDAKLGVFHRLDDVVGPEVVLASNTSSIPIGDLAAATDRPDRVIGMHFFNPPTVMTLVELISADTTSERTYDFARAFAERLGKVCVRSADRAGFIVNRLLIPYLNDAARLLDDGVATREDIDTAITLGLAHPMGPLRLMDLIGIDVMVSIARVLHDAFGEESFAPAPILERMLGEGRLGKKAGRGFYEYPAR